MYVGGVVSMLYNTIAVFRSTYYILETNSLQYVVPCGATATVSTVLYCFSQLYAVCTVRLIYFAVFHRPD